MSNPTNIPVRKISRKHLAFDVEKKQSNSVASPYLDSNNAVLDYFIAATDIGKMGICIDDSGLAYEANLSSPIIAIATNVTEQAAQVYFAQHGMLQIPGALFSPNMPVFLCNPTATLPNLTTAFPSISSGQYLQIAGYSLGTPVGMTTEWMLIEIMEPLMKD